MKTSIVKQGAEKTVNSIASIMNLIENSWVVVNEKLKLKEEITREYIGFWVNNKKAWLGQLIEMNDYIVFEVLDDNYVKKAEKIYLEKKQTMDIDKHENYIFAKIKIEDIYSFETENEQQELFQKWIREEVNILF